MKQSDLFSIIVPASTANLGPGFDSIGMALGLFLQVDVSVATEWEVIAKSPELSQFPTNERHFIAEVAIQAAEFFGATMPPCHLEVLSTIPLTRGLGSSASAIVAGLELANQVCGLGLKKEEKLRFASSLEGHVDNVGASIYGGLVVGRHGQEETDLISFPVNGIETVLTIPNFELKTAEARAVLPDHLDYYKAVEVSASANLLVAAAAVGSWGLLGKVMEEDQFHQPFRKKLVPELEDVGRIAKEHGAYGTALSGAGPTVISLVPVQKSMQIKSALEAAFKKHTILIVPIVNQGVQIKKQVGI